MSILWLFPILITVHQMLYCVKCRPGWICVGKLYMKNKITSANQIGPNYLRSIPSDVTDLWTKHDTKIYDHAQHVTKSWWKKDLYSIRNVRNTIFVIEDHTSKVIPVICVIQILISFPITTELWIFSILIAMCVLQQARTHSNKMLCSLHKKTSSMNMK